MRGKSVPFVKGDKRAGRPRGAKNKLPGGSIRATCQWLANERPELLHDAIMRGLAAGPPKSFPYVPLAAYYLDGKPVARIQFHANARMLFVASRPELGASLDDPDTIDE
jgi:hypothetical protein